MATLSTGYTFSASETVTAAKLAAQVNSASISDIASADLSDSIITSAKIVDGTIVNADINENAGIVGSKLDLSAPGIIGGTTPAAITGTTITATEIDVAANGGVALVEGTAPSTAAGEMKMYTKDTSGQPELFVREESDGDEVQITSGGVLNSGAIVQMVNYQRQDAVTVTSQIPLDTSKPQISEGDEVLSLAITPTNAGNNLRIDVSTLVDSDGSYNVTTALFRAGTDDALATANNYKLTNYPKTMAFTYWVAAGATTELTFSVRMGCPTGNSYLNRQASAAYLDGTLISSITITEIVP